jgi:hypothetical protein
MKHFVKKNCRFRIREKHVMNSLKGKNRMALVAGGWNDALLVEEGDQSEYLKVA